MDVIPSGSHGRDYVVEHVYHDRNKDEHVVLYMKKSTQLRITPNAKDRDPLGGTVTAAGRLYYKIDRDQQAGNYTGSSVNGTLYTSALDLRSLVQEPGVPVLGSFGDNGKPFGATAKDTKARYQRGMVGPNGDEWHVLTAWQDDENWFTGGPNGKVRASDGIVIPLVVGPVAPVMRFDAPPGGQFYTTPAKTYHVPVIHDQITYLEPRTRIFLYNLYDSQKIRYRVSGGDWQDYQAPFVAGSVLHFENHAAVLEVRSGTNGRIRQRLVVLRPSYPSSVEAHPRPILWRSSSERSAVLSRMKSGSSIVRSAYAGLRDFTFYSGMNKSFGDGVRHGWKDYEQHAAYALRNAFVCEVEGYSYQSSAYADHAKDVLLGIFAVEPIGMENPLWFPNPALERVTLGYEQAVTRNAAIAYSLLIASYRKDQGFTNGITPIEDLKIRDNFAGQVKTVMQFRDNSQTALGEGDMHWAVGLDYLALTVAACLPAYDTPYYGTSGADGKAAATHLWAPYPSQKVTWWESVRNPSVATPGYPNMRAKSRIFLIYQNGLWKGAKAYERLFYDLTPSIANIAKNTATAYPFGNIDSYCDSKSRGGLSMPMVINNKFNFVASAMRNLGTLTANGLRSVYTLSFYDESLRN